MRCAAGRCIAAIIAAALTLAACGGSATGGSPPATTSTATGATGGPGAAAADSASCRYGIADAIIVYTPDDVSYCRHWESIPAGGEGYRTVSGVGDHASYNVINGLLAFYGNTCIQTFNEHKIDRDFSLSADIALQQALRARL